MTADASSGNGSSPDAEVTQKVSWPDADVTERLPFPGAGPPVPGGVAETTERFALGHDDAEEDDKRSRSRLLLVIGLLCVIPLIALGLTIMVLYMPESAVAPSGETEKTPTVTNVGPTGPPSAAATPSNPAPAGAPGNVGTAATPLPPQSSAAAPSAGMPAQPGPTAVRSEARQPQTRQPPTVAPAPPVQRSVPAPAPAEPDTVDPDRRTCRHKRRLPHTKPRRRKRLHRSRRSHLSLCRTRRASRNAIARRQETSRQRCPTPDKCCYLTLQPLSMLWQCPLPPHVGQLQPQAIRAWGAGRGAGWTYSTSRSRRSRRGMLTP